MTRTERVAVLRKKFAAVFTHLNERSLRCWAGTEARALGRYGVTDTALATGLSRTTIYVGLAETQTARRRKAHASRIRRTGGGRKTVSQTDPTILKDLRSLIAPHTRGDPESLLCWSSKSTTKLTEALQAKGHTISTQTVWTLLQSFHYSMQGNRKANEGKKHQDRDAQFSHINDAATDSLRRGQPVVSVDAKKRELIGNYKNGGKEWHPKGKPTKVNTHDFPDEELGKVTPYGIYDFKRNEGWVNVGIDHNTAAFAVESIRRWWLYMGKDRYPKARELLITADSGGSNANRSRLWKVELQKLAEETGLTLHICHFPPGTSKWNKIEHRLFCHITANWRGRPLISRGMVVQLIGSVKTKAGLTVRAMLDENVYPTGIEILDEEMEQLSLEPEEFHGEWNYRIRPRVQV